MSPLVETIAFVFGLVGLGYLFARTGLFSEAVGDALSEFAVGVAVPALIFRAMVTAEFAGGPPWALWIAYFAAIAASWTLGQIVATRGFGREPEAGVVAGVACSFSNLALLGVPFMLALHGRAGFELLALLLAVHLPVMMAVSMILFEWARRGEGPFQPVRILRDFLVNLLTNPLILGILAGLAWRAGGLTMPSLGMRFVDALADVAGPVALIAMGLGLRKFGISGNVRPALALAAVKLLAMPAFALVAVWLVGLPPLAAKVAVAAASLPSGVNPYLIAVRFGTGQALASNTMTIATLAAVGSTAFWVAVAQRVFG